MIQLQEYAKLIDKVAPDELICGDECSLNREFVEAAWQVCIKQSPGFCENPDFFTKIKIFHNSLTTEFNNSLF